MNTIFKKSQEINKFWLNPDNWKIKFDENYIKLKKTHSQHSAINCLWIHTDVEDVWHRGWMAVRPVITSSGNNEFWGALDVIWNIYFFLEKIHGMNIIHCY